MECHAIREVNGAVEAPEFVGNPVGSRGYQADKPRDRPNPRDLLFASEELEPRRASPRWYGGGQSYRIGSQMDAVIRSIANLSSGKPRWRKIVEHADSLAKESGMTREEFYSTALIEMIEKLENARINSELTETYANIDQEEDMGFLNSAVLHYNPRLADE